MGSSPGSRCLNRVHARENVDWGVHSCLKSRIPSYEGAKLTIIDQQFINLRNSFVFTGFTVRGGDDYILSLNERKK